VRTELARLQRTEYVLFAMLENLAKTILTYLPPPAAENPESTIALGKAAYERYLKAVGMSLHNGSREVQNASRDWISESNNYQLSNPIANATAWPRRHRSIPRGH
jgi:hypothetical protein